ncbi:MAG TPA: hypothetical protein VJB87_03525 [Candidatus Nanoarchaeia archaeon]|nr:hypothetical protein [Candidatus Nanoarchaeia archaeon]
MKEFIKVLITVLAIVAGLFGLIRFVGSDLALFIGLCSLSFGITALFFTLKARSVLSKGSSLREYTTSFAFCLVFILIFSIWDNLIDLFQWQDVLIYPKYFFITLAYFVFVYTSYRIFNIGKEFGFVNQAKKIKDAMKK